VFGPSRRAAELEGSKAFAKRFLARHGIPTAPFAVFDDADAAFEHVHAQPHDLVVKADGLAAGKGVYVCSGAAEATAAVREMLADRAFGDAGRTVVIEKRLTGEEASLMALVDGERAWPLPPAQDHKRVGDGDTGPNTGGMGAVSPTPALPDALVERCMERIVRPTVRGMAAEGRPYRGVLYVGLMIAGGEPCVLEYNCRFGDPETQAVLARLDEDLAALLVACASGRLPDRPLRVIPGAAVTVVLAAGGYPGPYAKGRPIEGLEAAARVEGVTVLHAGTRRQDGRIVTASGRVLGVTAVGPAVAAARERADRVASLIRFEGVHYRKDIAVRAMR
jgi:phosphoribosylamine--glycine ligase